MVIIHVIMNVIMNVITLSLLIFSAVRTLMNMQERHILYQILHGIALSEV